MTISAGQPPADESLLASWEELRAADDIQFAEVVIPELPPREPGWFERAFKWLAENLGDLLGGAIGDVWPVLRWVLPALAIAALLFAAWRIFDPFARQKRNRKTDDEIEEWRPEQRAAAALLEDADRLAAQGRFDEATHLLLQRSVSHIAEARPDWVPPSSTARELARLAALPDPAREAFGQITVLVERSLFALRRLEKADWETARQAYANFALARLAVQGP